MSSQDLKEYEKDVLTSADTTHVVEVYNKWAHKYDEVSILNRLGKWFGIWKTI